MDPKLQATYDKVMDTPTIPQPSVAGAVSQPLTSVNPIVNTVSSTEHVISPNGIYPQGNPTPAYTQDNLNFQAAIQTPLATTPLANQTTVIAAPQQKSSSLLKMLYIIGAIVFFVAYTFLWIKIFNLPLPF